ncbi:MAG TPA: acyl-CoA dehydrogenase family protein [Acidimicrobiales bacterium]|nr:acyl-CoA dehydrogenase family protein [Acidimicrobiales bacterium]
MERRSGVHPLLSVAPSGVGSHACWLMDLELTDEQTFFQETTRKYLEREYPLSVVRSLEDDLHGFDRGYWRQVAELGWTSLLVPEEEGGGSVSSNPVADLAIVAEVKGRLVAPGPFLPINLVTAALGRSGAGDRHAEVLAGLMSGDTIATWAFAEANGRWDAAGVQLVAEADRDGFVLRGVKRFVEAAASADWFLVTARTGGDLTQFLVPATSSGLTVIPGRSVDLVRRFGDVRFEGVRVSASAVVGEVGARRRRGVPTPDRVAESVGAGDRVFEFTQEYMKDRWSFGRRLASYQALKHRIADMLLWLETGMGCAEAAARSVGSGAHSRGERGHGLRRPRSTC